MRVGVPSSWIRKWLVGHVTFASSVFLLLYFCGCIFIWIQWEEMQRASVGPAVTLKHQVDADPYDYPRQAWKKGEFKCLGWVETDDDGDESGRRRECWQRIRSGDAGYCEILNATSGEVFHLMHTTSLSLKDDARFTCELAKSFSSFRYNAVAYHHEPPMAPSELHSQGIVMAVYEQVLPSAFASIRRLRAVGCDLPVEIWFRHDELQPENPVLVLLLERFGPVHLRQIFDERIHGFFVKVHAVYYSQFTRVLLLDADNFVARDPTPLFSSDAMKKYGAVFWPDFWSPGNSIFNLHAQSLVWELLGIDYVDMAEQESGQVLVDRAVSRPMLERVLYYATHKADLFTKLQLVWGDKDLFRLAWLHMKRPFFYNDQRVPGTLGIVNQNRHRFCGMTMVQYDLTGQDILFLHRNTIKFSGRVDDRYIWHTLQELHPLKTRGTSNELPKILSFNGEKIFNETSCFGVKRYQMNEHVHMTAVENLGGDLPTLENALMNYARQAYELLHERGNH